LAFKANTPALPRVVIQPGTGVGTSSWNLHCCAASAKVDGRQGIAHLPSDISEIAGRTLTKLPAALVVAVVVVGLLFVKPINRKPNQQHQHNTKTLKHKELSTPGAANQAILKEHPEENPQNDIGHESRLLPHLTGTDGGAVDDETAHEATQTHHSQKTERPLLLLTLLIGTEGNAVGDDIG
jgi:hypothetical protein